MFLPKLSVLPGASALCLAVCACGDGGGSVSSASSSPPPPPPPPPPANAVSIFASPVPTEFASVGASAAGSDSANLSTPLGAISTAGDHQLHIRYTAAGNYEVELPGNPFHGFTWHPLSLYGHGTATTVLTDEGGDLLLKLSGAKDKGYKYSELASWQWNDEVGSDWIGAFAFGSLTPSGAVPVTGSATYSGIVAGKSDVIASDAFNGSGRAGVSGTVNLQFDFGAGSLAGAMTVSLSDLSGGSVPLGMFAFKDTVFAKGSTSYSGQFDASTAEANFFLGKFTGPNAQETIGAWALPFMLDTGNSSIIADHQAHQAFGAWIAAKP
jgi:hypothetical protein